MTGGGEDAGGAITVTPIGGGGADGGVAATGDGGAAGIDGGAAGPFKGLVAYVSKPVAVSARTSHANNGQAAQTPATDCLTCHKTGGAGVPFLAAGWVATAANGATGAADVEVGAYATGTGGNAFSAHTDADGFFWINPPNGGTTGPYCGGVRQATELDMPATQTNSDCNNSSCHGGATGPIHYP